MNVGVRASWLVFFFVSINVRADYSATSVRFSPLVLKLENKSRFQGGLNFQASPSAELGIAYVHKIYDGFDFGAGLHGGLLGSDVTSGVLGIDLMFRYLRELNPQIFIGAQIEGGIVYSGLGDTSILVNYGFAAPFSSGLVLGGSFREGAQVYIYPSIEFGRVANAGDPLWKSGVGFQIAFGTVITTRENLSLYLETQPAVTNFTGNGPALKTFSIGLTIGMLYDI